LIGNLTSDPESRTTQSGVSLCTFTIAVNRRHTAEKETDFFRVTAWRQLGEICGKNLSKGKKVAVVGTVSASAYASRDGSPKASLEVQADDVEFLTPKSETPTAAPQKAPARAPSGFIEVTDELPF
jgi:single-strand DNA-binding protein